MNDRHVSRRSFFQLLFLASGPGGFFMRHALADAATKLDVRDPAAVALGYVEEAGRVDQKKYPGYTPGSNCGNCLQLLGTPGGNYRPCSLFTGKTVAVSGWCSGWTAEM